MRRLLLALSVVLAACGKRGDPRPPVPIIPKAASDLVVTQRADKLLLSWSYPSLTTSGRSLPSVRRVSVFRYVEELPALPAGNAVTADLSHLNPSIPLTPAQFAKLSQRIDSIESANLPGSTLGAKLLYEDSLPQSTSGRPVRVTYAVVTEGQGARSDLSNLVSILPLDVSLPPAGLTAEAKQQGVVLNWVAPAATISGRERPPVAGYNIYRVAKGGSLDALSAPLNPAMVTETTFTDVPSYGTFEYVVTAVAAAGMPRVESDRSAPVAITFKDLVPPPPPASVTALVETQVVRLLWDAVEAPDLAGYNVYRTEKAGRVKFTDQLIKQTFFRDLSLLPGIEYDYSVTSVDSSGNESAETKSQMIMVPKTP